VPVPGGRQWRQQKPKNLKSPATGAPRPPTPPNTLIYYGALGLIYIACVIFVFTAFRLYNTTVTGEHGLRDFYPEMLLFAIAVFTALLGVNLLRSGLATVVPGPVINPDEWGVIGPEGKDGKDEAVSQYIRLRSLTGFTGTFTKLGLTGLPVATIGLTIFFALMYAYSTDAAYMDLAKLTLGAFIGSFVQKQVGEVRLPAGLWNSPRVKS
jgi:hypothetical protein